VKKEVGGEKEVLWRRRRRFLWGKKEVLWGEKCPLVDAGT